MAINIDERVQDNELEFLVVGKTYKIALSDELQAKLTEMYGEANKMVEQIEKMDKDGKFDKMSVNQQRDFIQNSFKKRKDILLKICDYMFNNDGERIFVRYHKSSNKLSEIVQIVMNELKKTSETRKMNRKQKRAMKYKSNKRD